MDKKNTVLIVEDQLINCKLLRKILEDEYEVFETHNGAQAWEVLKTNPDIDAVLTDVMMPVMDGYELLEKIRQASMTELPVIVMTGEQDKEAERKALTYGAWDFVPKPYNAPVLKSRLKNAIARRQVSVYRKMRKMAAHDSLTGLHNRNRTFEKTRKMLDENPDVNFEFLRIDIDHFALYNSAFGEAEGNKLLCYLADLFRGMMKDHKPSTLGRVNADVFCACVPYSDQEHKLLKAMVEETQNQLKIYRENYLLEISVGVYVIEDHSLSVEECYLRATMGTQKCKRQYGKHIGFYESSEGKNAALEVEIANEMVTALNEKQYVIYLQPKVNLSTNSISGAEALVRWLHPVKGLISPGLFIPVFESNGFIAQLDYYVWESTCQILSDWIREGKNPLPVSVNISRISLYNPQLVENLTNLVERYQFDISLLQLEITESAYMTSPELMQDTIHKLKQAGFTILMDDFGSGYSSLNTLKDIEVDVLKIDMKFLPINNDVEKGEIILASMIKMANWLGMSVVVEGVETREQRDFLEGAGCDYVQGFFYARPMPWKEYEEKYLVEDPPLLMEDPSGDPVPFPAHNVTILVIDDSEVDRELMRIMLQDRFHVHTCSNVEESLVYLKRNHNKVRLILVDNVMPGMSGLDFLTYCQDVPGIRAIPQIMITANDRVPDQVRAFQCGAYDYITKPLVKEVVLARVNHVMEISRQYRVFENGEYNYRSQAEKDQMTGLLNKKTFNELCSRHLESHLDEQAALLVFDCDDFKTINDGFGHLVGDKVIINIAKVLSGKFRKTDLVGRFGGDEFMVLMTQVPDPDIVRSKGTEIIKSTAILCAQKLQVNVSISIGVAFRQEEDTVEDLFGRADIALYESKTSGKGRVVVYGEKVPPILDDEKPIVLICGEDPQLYPSIALAYGESAAFASVNSLEELQEVFQKYGKRIRLICMDMQKKHMEDSTEFYEFILKEGGGTQIPIVGVCKEGNMDHLRSALELDIQDIITLPPQIDAIQRKLSRLIATGCM